MQLGLAACKCHSYDSISLTPILGELRTWKHEINAPLFRTALYSGVLVKLVCLLLFPRMPYLHLIFGFGATLGEWVLWAWVLARLEVSLISEHCHQECDPRHCSSAPRHIAHSLLLQSRGAWDLT